ncbi:GH92 family glycosyl hydrolase [Mangrovimonas sp. AS39]|uniref:GH92 family glycosyl hydrolase n=1 Tax=Mangrovimonas futianensis TaxID=2895523 RepID=UPI001E4A56A0|nr:GH92 family glycosyl hydrolase [Mangrovimonas futianensis]MCF1190001.1 GH92 family glycosyl hydrolase [Mangrovimonas futianensis]MCF1194248.1 GH92 family glycosyl hydrolase [Mangrovimonas futianensis]
MKFKFSPLFIVVLLISSCQKPSSSTNPKTEDQNLTSYVNPFIGTGGHGHTFPGATLPFGMMQLSPDTRLDGWDGCSGYHYSDSYIYGFSHTHLSGTGVSDYGDILLMPTTSVQFNNGSDGKPGYKAPFTHKNEIATPGYYEVKLDSTDIKVNLTVSQRSGIHQYQFPSHDNQFVVLDLEHRDKLLSHEITQIDNKTIQGHRHSAAWATDQRLYFYITFSEEIASIQYNQENQPTKVVFEFKNPNNNPVYAKVGISAVDGDGARKNLEQEIGQKSFDEVKSEAQNLWESQLQKIVVETPHQDDKVNFYSALYHTMIAPNLYQDVDGRYRGMDLKIHQNEDFDYYTVFSLWDTYRATHPLYTIIEQERTNDFINTFIAKNKEGGIMPIWDLSGCYTGCMIGYHAVPVIADAYLKGIRGYDADQAFEAMVNSATQDHLGLDSYKSLAFIPVENESESVSKTLEYAYDDWTIAQMAKAMGNEKVYEDYLQRAQFYKNIFDPESQFMRGRFRNTWFAPFDPYEVNFNYTEANSWQYSFYVPQDISGFMTLLGGKEALEKRLDDLFTANVETSGRQQADITGLIGQYAHGNEPSHHMAYLYNFVNKPYKTQERVSQILNELYKNDPDGISGNEDCGQMSAWYVFSSMGFYPVTPGSNTYIIGTPLMEESTIHLENGNTFTIIAENLSKENKYIQSVLLNDTSLEQTFINHEDITKGGTLKFTMGNAPSQWGTQEGNQPKTSIDKHLIVPVPFIAEGDVAFKGETLVALKSVDVKSNIFYSVNGIDFMEYKKPFKISDKTELKVYAESQGKRSPIVSTQFYKIDPNISIHLKKPYANQYNGGGQNALIDGIFGTQDFRTGVWQGFHDNDLIATVNLGSTRTVEEIGIGFLEDQRSWIFLPSEVECFGSLDGTTFEKIDTIINFDSSIPKENSSIQRITFKTKPKSYQYIKIHAKTLGQLPEWHISHEDGRSWLFADEISIN